MKRLRLEDGYEPSTHIAQLVNYDPGQSGITVNVVIGLNGARAGCEAKIDTGSTFCLFARNVSEDLGIDVESGIRRTVGTVTGNFAVYLHEVNLYVVGCSFSALVGFAEDRAFQRNVLRRRGFLEQVIFGLVDYEGKLFLSSYDEYVS